MLLIEEVKKELIADLKRVDGHLARLEAIW